MSKSKPKSTRKTKTVKKRTSSTANNKVTTTKKTKRTKTSVPGNRPHNKETVTLERELRKFCNKPQNNITYEYLISKGNNFHGEDWGGAGIRNKIPSLRRFTPGQLNNSLRTLRRNAAAAAAATPKKQKQKMSKTTTAVAAKAAKKKPAKSKSTLKKTAAVKDTPRESSTKTSSNTSAKKRRSSKKEEEDDEIEEIAAQEGEIRNGTSVSKVYTDPTNNGKPRKYIGTVISYNNDTRKYSVEYDDGDIIEYGVTALRKMIAQPGQKKGGSNKKQSQTTATEKKKGKKRVTAAAASAAASATTKSTRKSTKRGRAVEEEAVDKSSNKRATRNSNRINQQQKSNAVELEENSDEGGEQPPTSPTSSTTSKDKGGDKVADKENDTLDTNKDKEEGSPSKESDLVDDSSGDKDDHQHDLQFSDNEGGGGGDMQLSPTKSVSSTRSEITTTMSTEITSMLEHDIQQQVMPSLESKAVHLLGQTMEQVSTDIITPLQNEITDIEDEITNTKQVIEFQTSLQSQASKKLPTGIDLGIDINDMDKVKEKNTPY